MFMVDRSKCIACKQCIMDCPVADILLKEGKAHIKNENCIKCGHCIAICPTYAVSTNNYDMNEVLTYNKENFHISSDTLLNFIKFRRSIRRFKNKPVEEEKIKTIIESGRFTETGTNSQDVSYIAVTKDLEKLSNLTYEILNNKGKYILDNMTDETRHLEKYASLWTKMYLAHKEDSSKYDRLFFNAPCIIIITAFNELNGALAASRMALMVNALGLGTFFNGFFQFAAKDNKEIEDFLEIEAGKKIVACMVIGYPDVNYKRTVPRNKASITWK